MTQSKQPQEKTEELPVGVVVFATLVWIAFYFAIGYYLGYAVARLWMGFR